MIYQNDHFAKNIKLLKKVLAWKLALCLIIRKLRMKSFLEFRPLKELRENRLGVGHCWVCGLESDSSRL